jgi:hypothetical protein
LAGESKVDGRTGPTPQGPLRRHPEHLHRHAEGEQQKADPAEEDENSQCLSEQVPSTPH